MVPVSSLERFLHSPLRTFFSLWLPVLFSMVAEPLTGLVDTAFVSTLGAEPLAALGVGTVVLTSGLWLFNFLSVGSQTEVSQASGRSDMGRGKSIGSLALLFALLIGVILAAASHAFAAPLSLLMGATAKIQEHAVTYIQIRAFGAPAVLFTMTAFGILYGLADMRSPLVIAIVVNAMNIILDGFLIFGLGPFPAMEIAGAALASTISQYLGAIWCCYLVYMKMGYTRNIRPADISKLLRIGRDMILRTGSLLLFLLVATRSATRLGAESGAAHQAIRQVWVFTSLFLDSSAITAQSLTGYFFGSGRIVNARRVAGLVCGWSVFIAAVLMTAMIGGTGIVTAALVPASSLSLFYPAWIISAGFQPIAGLAFATDGIHWGTGDFAYLRNCVVFAAVFAVFAILAAELIGKIDLTMIWWITGGWIMIRACFGLLRIWPGMGVSPLKLKIQAD